MNNILKKKKEEKDTHHPCTSSGSVHLKLSSLYTVPGSHWPFCGTTPFLQIQNLAQSSGCGYVGCGRILPEGPATSPSGHTKPSSRTSRFTFSHRRVASAGQTQLDIFDSQINPGGQGTTCTTPSMQLTKRSHAAGSSWLKIPFARGQPLLGCGSSISLQVCYYVINAYMII